jgi:hypothetical protein
MTPITAKSFVAVHDVIWQNIKCSAEAKQLKRVASILILVALFFTLALPSVHHSDKGIRLFPEEPGAVRARLAEHGIPEVC